MHKKRLFRVSIVAHFNFLNYNYYISIITKWGITVKKYVSALSCAMAAFLIMSCGSTPKNDEDTTIKDVVPVEDVKEEVQEEIKPVIDYSAANQTLFTLCEAARENAIASGAEKYYPEKFNAAETALESLKKDMADNAGNDYSVQIKDLTARYQSLAAASQAQTLKEKADALSLGDEDKASYEAGAKALEEYAAMGTGANGADLLEKANEALNAYNDVVNKGLKANAARERKAALEAKKLADSVKAGVAQKEVYTKASDTFKKADASYVTANIEGAFNGYKSAKETFNSLYEDISAKRAAAQALIDAAKQRVADSANYAEEADTIAPLATEVAGIEQEDAVLLEEDKFEDPKNAEINVEEGITAKAAEKVAETAIKAEEAVNDAVEDANMEAK